MRMMCLPWGIKLDEGQAFTHNLIKVAFTEYHHLGLVKDRREEYVIQHANKPKNTENEHTHILWLILFVTNNNE